MTTVNLPIPHHDTGVKLCLLATNNSSMNVIKAYAGFHLENSPRGWGGG